MQSGLIHVRQQMMVAEPRRESVHREPDEEYIRVLVVPNEGEQSLVVVYLPRDCSYTVQDVLNLVRKRREQNGADLGCGFKAGMKFVITCARFCIL